MSRLPQSMQALVYEGPRVMTMHDDVPVPESGSDEVLIRVHRVGICGSEISGYLGHNSLRKPPLVMGHEFSGIVERIGSGVTTLREGDRVTVNPLVTCGSCAYCTAGREQLCPQRQLLGAHRPGAFAEYVAAPAANVHKLPDDVSLEQGAFVEPVACAAHVLRLLALQPEDRLLITGAGPIGIFVLLAAQAYGLRDVVITDVNPERLEVAKQLGGIAVSDLGAHLAASQGDGFAAAVDAVGLGITRKQCVESVRTGGKVVFTGLHEAESVLPINLIIRSEVQMTGAFAYSPVDFAIALKWIAEGRMNLLPWTTFAPLAGGGECFEKLVSGPGPVVKFMLEV